MRTFLFTAGRLTLRVKEYLLKSNEKSLCSIKREPLAGIGCLSLFLMFMFSASNLIAQPEILWERTVTSVSHGYTYMNTFLQTPDGGYILAGQSDGGIGGEKTEPSRGSIDYWVIKLRPDRSIEWDKTYGGELDDVLKSVVPTDDGGYLLGGDSNSDAGGEKSEDCLSVPDQDGILPPDYWLVKISSDGTKIWDKTYGGLTEDFFKVVKPTPDGGFILGGGVNGGYDILKLDKDGNKEWGRNYKGKGGFSIFGTINTTSDNGYIMVGGSDSGVGNDKTSGSKGSNDFWIIKIDSKGSIQWDKTYGGGAIDEAGTVIQTSDGGYIVTGTTNSSIGGDKTEERRGYYDAWVLKLGEDGSLSWEKTLGGSEYLVGNAYYTGSSWVQFFEESPAGHIVVAGSSTGKASADKTGDIFGAWMVTLDQNGKKVSDLTLPYQMAGFQKTKDGGFLLGGGGYRIAKFFDPTLPVTLTQFTTKKEKTTALLTWTTTSETRSDRFEIQRSNNGKSWNLLGKVNAIGESTDLVEYQYFDTNPVMGSENLYRLKMIDTDGTFAYSKINSLTFDPDLSLTMFPNPVSEILTIKMADWKDVTDVQLINSQSTIVYKSTKHLKNELDVTKLSSGIYSLKITKSDGSYLSHKIVVAR